MVVACLLVSCKIFLGLKFIGLMYPYTQQVLFLYVDVRKLHQDITRHKSTLHILQGILHMHVQYVIVIKIAHILSSETSYSYQGYNYDCSVRM